MIGLLGVPRASRPYARLMGAVAATEALGLTVVGVYDAQFNASSTSWGDARATNGGPTITLTGSPTLSNGVYTFNGTDQYGTATNGRLGEITGDCAMVLVGAQPTAVPSAEIIAQLRNGAVIPLQMQAPALGTFRARTGDNADVAVGSGVRVAHARRTGTGTVTVGARIGSGAEVTASGARTNVTPTILSIGAADTPSNYADITVRTFVVIKGDYTAAAAAIWNQYGALRGATV